MGLHIQILTPIPQLRKMVISIFRVSCASWSITNSMHVDSWASFKRWDIFCYFLLKDRQIEWNLHVLGDLQRL
jgi:hypothetical protein